MTEEKYYNFTNCKTVPRFYGGKSGRKRGIYFKDTNYLLKLPSNIRDKEILNVDSSYANSTVSEYIGSHIYKILEIPVHKTILGIFKEVTPHIAVACEDFNKQKGDKFISFGEIKTTFIPKFFDSNGNSTNGFGTDLEETLKTIEQHPIFIGIREQVTKRFWQMFIVDCLIANSDRNNGNWGLIQHLDEKVELAPVFDNGGCLHNTWDDNKIITLEQNKVKNIVDNQVCVYTNKNEKVNPSHYMLSTNNQDCIQTFKELYPKIKIKLPEINSFINSVPASLDGIKCCSNKQKQIYKFSINRKFDTTFKLMNEKVFSLEMQELSQKTILETYKKKTKENDFLLTGN